jgi:hypothetical protein
MQIARGTQYQGYPESLTVKGVQYFKTPTANSYNRKTFSFDNIAEWSTGTVPSASTQAPITNIGTELFQGITDSVISVNGFDNYNPLSQVTRETTKPNYLLKDQSFVKVVNTDFKDATSWKFTAKGQTAGDTVKVRLYTDATTSNYVDVTMTMPIAGVEYTFNFNPFIAGSYGTVTTPIAIGAKSFASGQAIVANSGTVATTIIQRIAVTGLSNSGTSKITPIALEAGNSIFSNYGNKFQVEVCCLSELTDSLERTYKELKCGKRKNGKSLDEQNETITFKIQKNNMLLRALGFGSDMYEKDVTLTTGPTKLTLINSTPNIIANITGDVTMSIANDTNIDYITIDSGGDCITLLRDRVKNTTATLDPNTYYVDVVNNRIVFANEIYTYGTVNVYTKTTRRAIVIDHYTEQNPVKVLLEWQTKNVAGTRTRFRKVVAELGYPKDSVEDDGNTTEFECTVLLTGYDQSIEGEF